MKKQTQIIYENENGLPYLAVRSAKANRKNVPEKESIDWSVAINVLFAHTIFALGFMMLGAAITLQVIAR